MDVGLLRVGVVQFYLVRDWLGGGVGLVVSVVLVFTFWLTSVVVVLDCVGFGCLAVWAL